MGLEEMPTDDMSPKSHNQSQLKNIALFSYDDQDALATLRLLGPAKMAGWNILRGYDFDDDKVHIERVDDADMVFIQRDFCRDYDTYSKIRSLLATQKKPLLIDLDDNLFEIPPDHPDRLIGYYADALLPMYQVVKEADLVTVATVPLRDYLLPFNPNIQVVPNYLDDSIWELAPRAPRNDENVTITIGYMGGWTHRPDLQMVVPVLKGLLEKYPGRIQYHFWGIDAPVELERYSQVDWYPLLFTRYDEFANAFKSIDADILIAPLCDNSFNACKSCIKFLEYGAVGIPAIFSRVRPYIDTVENGKDGFLASTYEEWMAGLSQLIESPGLRTELVKNAQEKIRKNWLLSINVARRIQIYEEAIANFQPKVRESSPAARMEQTLSILNYEEAVRKDKQVKSLKAQGVEKDEHIFYLDHNLKKRDENIKQLEEEILSYVMSRSWRLTRPIRGFSRFLKRLLHV